MVKVGKKVFVFLGHPEDAAAGLSVKLRESHDEALAMDFTTPRGTGSGGTAGSAPPSRPAPRSPWGCCVTGSTRAIV